MRRKQHFFIWLFILLVVFLFANLFTPLSSRIESSVFSFLSPIQKVMVNASNGLLKNMEILQNVKEIREEVEYLRKENRKLSARLAELDGIKEENRALREALNIDFEDEINLVFSEVVGRDFSNYRVIIRHKGKAEEGSAVLTPEGVFAGVVLESYENFSKIELAIKPENSFKVKIQGEDSPVGTTKGTGENTLLLDLLPKDKEIKRGDNIVTLPQREKIPGNLFVGRVLEVHKSDVEAFFTADIWQGINYRYLDYLFIVEK